MGGQQREDVEPKYETFYRAFAQVIRSVLAEPGDPLAKYRHLQLLIWSVWGLMSWMMNGENRRISAQEQDAWRYARLQENAQWDEGDEAKSGTCADYILSHSQFYARIAAEHVPEGTDIFLDLGCGWGHRMVDMFLGGLRTQFFGGDRSLHSRDATLATTSLFPEMKAGWFRFDFLNPAFTGLPDARKVCLFSCHAIEQVEHLGSALFDRILERYPKAAITGIHIEPIAFQIDPMQTQVENYVRAARYNTDLVESVRKHPTLRVKHAEAIVYRKGGDTASLFVWERA